MTAPNAKPANDHAADGFWTDTLAQADPEVHAAVSGELKRQQDKIELRQVLSPGTDFVSLAVVHCTGGH